MKAKISKFLLKHMKSFYVLLFSLFTIYSIVFFVSNYDLLSFDDLQYDSDSLDLALKWRLNSPPPSNQIVIVEVDEKSLESMALEYGRWPWPRYVFADLIYGLEEVAPNSIFFNILFTDPDITDPDSDEVLNFAISEYANLVFPASRLNPTNDSLSEIKSSQVPFISNIIEDKTVALLLTFFPSALQKMGLNNLFLDDDGVVRKAQLYLEEEKLKYRTVLDRQLSLITDEIPPHTKVLVNWPDQDEDYTRYSFSDIYMAIQNGDYGFYEDLNGKNIIIGMTAAGLSIQRPIPNSPYRDDNFILASQLDSLAFGQGLKTAPPIIILMVAIAFFAFFSYAGYKNLNKDILDYCFYTFEIISVAISIISISYTNYFIDLSYPVTSAGLFFILIYAYRYPVNERLSGKTYWLLYEELITNKYYSMFLLKNRSELKKVRKYKEIGVVNDIYELDNFVSSDLIFADVFSDTFLVIIFHDAPLTSKEIDIESASKLLDIETNEESRLSLPKNILNLYQRFNISNL